MKNIKIKKKLLGSFYLKLTFLPINLYRYWSREGVTVSDAETSESQLTCLSFHLTTFAGLFQFTEVTNLITSTSKSLRKTERL